MLELVCGTTKGLWVDSTCNSWQERRLSHCFVAVMKCPNQKQLTEDRIYFGLRSQRVSVHDGRKTWQQTGAGNRELVS